MQHTSKFRVVLAMIGAGFVATHWSEPASAQIIDCDDPSTPPNALQDAINDGQYLIEFTGTCNEFLGVYRDNVHLQGANSDPALNVINGEVSIAVAQDIFIENLKIQGDSFSITNGAQVYVRDSIIADTDHGVFISRGSTANLDRNTFGPALVDVATESCVPICVSDNSHATMRDNTVNGTANDPDSGAALAVFRDSSVSMRGGNKVTNTGTQFALGIWWDSSVRQDAPGSSDTGEINGGVVVFGDSLFDTRQAEINGDITAGLTSTLRIGTTATFSGDPSLMVIEDAIELSLDSALFVGSPQVTINGDVTCADDESSAEGSFAGTGKNLCSGFSSVENDFNGDGKADLLWRHDTSGLVVIWLMDGSAKLASAAIGKPSLDWQIDKVEDYNGDGKSDIFWRQDTTGANIVWLMDGFTTTPRPIPSVPIAWVLQP